MNSIVCVAYKGICCICAKVLVLMHKCVLRYRRNIVCNVDVHNTEGLNARIARERERERNCVAYQINTVFDDSPCYFFFFTFFFLMYICSCTLRRSSLYNGMWYTSKYSIHIIWNVLMVIQFILLLLHTFFICAIILVCLRQIKDVTFSSWN